MHGATEKSSETGRSGFAVYGVPQDPAKFFNSRDANN
jgi:hypothetical protein